MILLSLIEFIILAHKIAVKKRNSINKALLQGLSEAIIKYTDIKYNKYINNISYFLNINHMINHLNQMLWQIKFTKRNIFFQTRSLSYR